MAKQQSQVPQENTIITVDGIDYVVVEAYRLSDKGKKFQGKPYSDNVMITARRPRGKRFYYIAQYPNGVYSQAV